MFIEVLFVIFLIIALVDLVLMIQISNAIGIYVIIFSQLISAAIGLFYIRKLDFNLYFFLDAEIKKQQTIIKELWDEAFVLTGACFLIVPGFLSDVVGIICLIPKFRIVFLEWLD